MNAAEVVNVGVQLVGPRSRQATHRLRLCTCPGRRRCRQNKAPLSLAQSLLATDGENSSAPSIGRALRSAIGAGDWDLSAATRSAKAFGALERGSVRPSRPPSRQTIGTRAQRKPRHASGSLVLSGSATRGLPGRTITKSEPQNAVRVRVRIGVTEVETNQPRADFAGCAPTSRLGRRLRSGAPAPQRRTCGVRGCWLVSRSIPECEQAQVAGAGLMTELAATVSVSLRAARSR